MIIFQKKGDLMDCAKSRSIKVIAHTMKICEPCRSAFRRYVEPASDHFGFVPEVLTVAIFITREVVKKNER